jgi:hypothetical protein
MKVLTGWISRMLWAMTFWLFVAIKVAGTTFATWSWWWVLFPPIPAVSLLVRHFGL